jgi:DEAD/DEAH box helicase domain-containing protein
LETPPFQHETTGTWVDVPKGIIQLMRAKGLNPAEGIHAAQHAILNCFSMANDLRTECRISKKEYMANQSSRKRPARLIFYDVPGRSGEVAAKAFDHGMTDLFCLSYPLKMVSASSVSNLVHQAYEMVEGCPCEEGCVRCEQTVSNKCNLTFR